jgi:hypothetical protein
LVVYNFHKRNSTILANCSGLRFFNGMLQFPCVQNDEQP